MDKELGKIYMEMHRQEMMNNAGCGPMVGVMVLLMVVLLCGCRTKYVPVETIKTEYKVRTDTIIQKDSVYLKDSVFIHSNGDTTLVEKWHTQYIDKWKERIKCDTLIKNDSIMVPFPVEKPLGRWEKFYLNYGKVMFGGSITLVLLIAVLISARLYKKRII